MRLLRRLFLVALAVASRGGMALAGPTPSPAPVPSGAQCLGSACFALFWAARSFPEAAAVCQEGGGHLMTVRSTVAAEAIALLLPPRGGPGSAWLGLRLPEGSCQDPAKQLRGFQWVSGDEQTDYAAWAGDGTGSGSAAPVCGSRCVVVAQALRWEERACQAPADGFLCEYSYPRGTCVALTPPPPAEVSYHTPFGARETDLVALPPGTVARVPGLGATLECRTRGDGSHRWDSAEEGAWDCRLENGGCEGECRRDGRGRPYCTCPGGANSLEEDGRSCGSPCARSGCQDHCVPQGDAAVCMCWEGYVLGPDGRSCVDLDDCGAEPSPCEQVCLNTPGGFECQCSAGFQMVEGQCQEDRRPCFDLSCQHECVLVNGTHKCACFEGYVPDPLKPHECVMFCDQPQCPAQCDPHTGATCECPDGFILDVKEDGAYNICTDIDECQSGHCGELECINVPGSYKCICPKELSAQEQVLCDDQETETEGSGETESYPRTPVATPVPTKDGSSQGMLVETIVCTHLMGVVIVVILATF